jgi:hypothetical protein
MRRHGSLLLAIILASAAATGHAAGGNDPTQLSANELAEVLGVHWWFIRFPDTIKSGASIGVQWIDSDGSQLAGGSATMTNTSLTAGVIAKIFCKETPNGPEITIRTPGGFINTSFPDVSFAKAAIGGLANGTEAHTGDVLLKLVWRAKDGSLTVYPGNTLNPGDIGLRVFIRPAPRN